MNKINGTVGILSFLFILSKLSSFFVSYPVS